MQNIKIALALSIAVIIPVYNVFPTLIQKGFWSVLVIALTQDENVSSSFLNSYQRIEGTVIGSIFAFAVSQILSCDSTSLLEGVCVVQFSVQITVLVAWWNCHLFIN
jgi:uncharacterized membrane protein YccC